MIQTADVNKSAMDHRAITVRDVMAFLGASKSAANRLLTRLEADGLRRKGGSTVTRYDRQQFLALWEKMDTRP